MKRTVHKVLLTLGYLLVLSSLSACALVSNVEAPNLFGDCPDISGSYLNVNSIKNEKHVLNLSDFYFFQTGWLFRTFALERFHSMKAYHNLYTSSDSSTIKDRMWEWPGNVHIFWIDKNKQILAVIFASPFTIESGFITSLKEVEQSKTIFESRYVSLTNLDNFDGRDHHTYLYCRDGKILHSQAYFSLWGSVVTKVKNKISFDVDKHKNLISHQEWSKYEALLSAEEVEEGLWKATNWKIYNIDTVYPSSRIAAILSNLNGAVHNNNLVIDSEQLKRLNTLVADADVELRYFENTQQSCEHLKQASNTLLRNFNIDSEVLRRKIKENIDTVVTDLNCENK